MSLETLFFIAKMANFSHQKITTSSSIQHPPTGYLVLSSTEANKKGWVSKGLVTNEEKNHECHARNIKPMVITLTHG
jgi:hypothetical protein